MDFLRRLFNNKQFYCQNGGFIEEEPQEGSLEKELEQENDKFKFNWQINLKITSIRIIK